MPILSSRQNNLRAVLLAAAALAVAVGLLFARPHPTPGPPMRDFEAYYAAGAVWDAGGDPYGQAIWQAERALPGVNASRYEALPFVGPPAVLPIFGAIARLPFPAANALWRALLILSVAGIALLTLRISRHTITPAFFVAIVIAALGFGPVTSALALGQLALPAFLFAALALLWQPAAMLAWIQPNVAIVLLSQMYTRRGALAFAAALAVFVAVCIAIAGIGGAEHYARILQLHGAAERFSAIQLAPASIAYGFGASVRAGTLVGATVAAVAIGWWLLLMRALRTAAQRFCATCALLPLAVPFFHEHDLLVLFVPAIVYATRSNRMRAIAMCGALLAATDWLGLAQRPDGTVQTLLLIGALGAAIVAMHERPEARMLIVPAAVLALIGAAAVVAHAHPAPVWPDAMRSLPASASSVDIATAWNAEQRASGLFAPNAVWAALRLLSLSGSVLLAAAVSFSLKSPADSKNPLPVPA